MTKDKVVSERLTSVCQNTVLLTKSAIISLAPSVECSSIRHCCTVSVTSSHAAHNLVKRSNSLRWKKEECSKWRGVQGKKEEERNGEWDGMGWGTGLCGQL